MERSGVCEHCSTAMRPGDVVSRNGYSYHKKCHKCYVCSETDLQDAEVFQGVIFCSSCARRIFKGCATARTAKASPAPPAPPRRRRRNMSRSVLERARAAASGHTHTDSFCKTTTAPTQEPPISDCYCVSDVITQAKRLINLIYYQSHNFIKHGNAGETPNTAEVCQKMLEILKCPSEPSPHAHAYTESRTTTTVISKTSKSTTQMQRSDRSMKITTDAPCSDPRMAEIGVSTEIATMALRKASKKRVPHKSKYNKNNDRHAYYTMGVNKESALSQTSNEESLDTESDYYSELKENDQGILYHTVASLLKMPYKFFKKKVLERSSLVSVIIAMDAEDTSLCGRLKTLFNEDMIDHHRSGYKKLYSTINKKQMPYKMGWPDQCHTEDLKSNPCKHFHECHSYRCMREQAMRLAGPTKSKIDGFRSNLKKVIVPPFFKNLSIQYKNPAMLKSTACGKSDTAGLTQRTETRRKEKHGHGEVIRPHRPHIPSTLIINPSNRRTMRTTH